MSVNLARAASKTAFQRMMDAATKAAILCTALAEESTDPTLATKWRDSARAWQNSAQVAYQEASKL